MSETGSMMGSMGIKDQLNRGLASEIILDFYKAYYPIKAGVMKAVVAAALENEKGREWVRCELKRIEAIKQADIIKVLMKKHGVKGNVCAMPACNYATK